MGGVMSTNLKRFHRNVECLFCNGADSLLSSPIGANLFGEWLEWACRCRELCFWLVSRHRFSTSLKRLGVGDSLLDGYLWVDSIHQRISKGFCFAWICRFFYEESRQFGWAFGLSLHLVARMQKRPQICSFLVVSAIWWAFFGESWTSEPNLCYGFGYGFRFGNEDVMRDNP